MRKVYLTLCSLFLAGLTQAASLQYIPSTSTFFNYRTNIASASLRNFTVQTATASWFHASSASIDSLTISTITAPFIVISSGTGNFSNLTATGAVIGTMTVTGETVTSSTISQLIVTESTFTRQIVGISTITNGTIQNANLGQVFSTGTWTFSNGIINGIKIDNSTTTLTGTNYFRGSVAISTSLTQQAVFDVETTSITIGSVGEPLYARNTTTYFGQVISSSVLRNVAPIISSNTDTRLAQIDLPPGNYILGGYGGFGVSGSGSSIFQEAAISRTTSIPATSGGAWSNPVNGEVVNMLGSNAIMFNQDLSLALNSYVTLTVNTRFFLVVHLATVTGSPSGYGSIWAVCMPPGP